MNLAERRCEACRADSPAVVGEERTALLASIPGWDVADEGGIPQLVRTFDFADFVAALEFTNQVGALAEAEDHHPSITTEWGKVTVTWWTHTIKGLHLNDFIMAARCDAAFAET